MVLNISKPSVNMRSISKPVSITTRSSSGGSSYKPSSQSSRNTNRRYQNQREIERAVAAARKRKQKVKVQKVKLVAKQIALKRKPIARTIQKPKPIPRPRPITKTNLLKSAPRKTTQIIRAKVSKPASRGKPHGRKIVYRKVAKQRTIRKAPKQYSLIPSIPEAHAIPFGSVAKNVIKGAQRVGGEVRDTGKILRGGTGRVEVQSRRITRTQGRALPTVGKLTISEKESQRAVHKADQWKGIDRRRKKTAAVIAKDVQAQGRALPTVKSKLPSKKASKYMGTQSRLLDAGGFGKIRLGDPYPSKSYKKEFSRLTRLEKMRVDPDEVAGPGFRAKTRKNIEAGRLYGLYDWGQYGMGPEDLAVRRLGDKAGKLQNIGLAKVKARSNLAGTKSIGVIPPKRADPKAIKAAQDAEDLEIKKAEGWPDRGYYEGWYKGYGRKYVKRYQTGEPITPKKALKVRKITSKVKKTPNMTKFEKGAATKIGKKQRDKKARRKYKILENIRQPLADSDEAVRLLGTEKEQAFIRWSGGGNYRTATPADKAKFDKIYIVSQAGIR